MPAKVKHPPSPTARPKTKKNHQPPPQQTPTTPRGISLDAFHTLMNARQRTTNRPRPTTYPMPGLAPGVLPKNTGKRSTTSPGLVHDDLPPGLSGQQGSWALAQFHGLFDEGIGFMGYPYLAELTQRPEYRQPSEVIAEEMTRNWISVVSKGRREKSQEVDDLTDAIAKYKLREVFRDGIELAGFMGIAPIYPDLKSGAGRSAPPVSDQPAILETPLVIARETIPRGSLTGFNVVDPTWIAPTSYNSINPLRPDFFRPQQWFVMGNQVHHSRLMNIIPRPVPDILRPAYNFGGISLSQMMKPYVDNWLRTRQSVSDLVSAFTVWVVSTNLMASVMGGGSGDEMEKRLAIFGALKSNYGVMAIDKDSEDFKNVAAPLGTLDKLQAQAQEHQSAVARIPLIKLLGITPSGLNASTDGEIRTFYDSIRGWQQRIIRDHLQRAIEIVQLSEFGRIDPDLGFEFNPLWQLDEAGAAAVRKIDMDTDAVAIGNGVIDPDEARERIRRDPASPYAGLEGSAPGLPPEESDYPTPPAGDPAEKIANRSATIGSQSGV